MIAWKRRRLDKLFFSSTHYSNWYIFNIPHMTYTEPKIFNSCHKKMQIDAAEMIEEAEFMEQK